MNEELRVANLKELVFSKSQNRFTLVGKVVDVELCSGPRLIEGMLDKNRIYRLPLEETLSLLSSKETFESEPIPEHANAYAYGGMWLVDYWAVIFLKIKRIKVGSNWEDFQEGKDYDKVS